jgi:WD40 repeat protein
MSEPGRGGAEATPADERRQGWPAATPPRRPLGQGDPEQVGPYRLEAVLGAGGMGRVYLGLTPAGSEVAVKLVHREFAADVSFRKRFALEVAAARRVQGLYTVPVVDADLEADEPWLATAYVPGPSLQQAVDEGGPLAPDAVLSLTARVAEALQSIHAAGVIHRDLKPANIILTAEGPKVIDFGIARAADVTSVTGTGVRAGTPAYMAPEYIRGQELTPAVDVFALGLVANYAASGRLAFGGGSGYGVAYRILEQEPELDACPEAVRTVAARCLAKDPRERPAPARIIELCRGTSAPVPTAVDVHAAPTRPAAAVAAADTSPAPVAPARPRAAGAAGQGSGRGPAGPAAPIAPGHRPPNPYVSLGTTARGWSSTRISWVAFGGSVLAVVLLIAFSGLGDEDQDPPPQRKPTAALETPEDAAADVTFSPDGKTLAVAANEGRIRLWDVSDREQRVTLTQHLADGEKEVQQIGNVAFSPDGKMIAAQAINRVGLWDVAERRQIAAFEAGAGDILRDLAFSPDGRTLVTGGDEGRVHLFDAQRGREERVLATFDHDVPVRHVSFSSDGRTVAAAGNDEDGEVGSTRLWDASDRDTRRTLRHDRVSGLAFSADGKTVYTAHGDVVRSWDAADGGEGDPVVESSADAEDVLASPDGDTLATVAWEEGVRLWSADDGEALAILPMREEVNAMAYSPKGGLFATAEESGVVRLWKTK